MIRNLSLNPVSGEDFASIRKKKSTKKSFKNLRNGPQETVSKHLKEIKDRL